MAQEIAWLYAAHAARVAGGCSRSKAGAHRGERPDNQASRAAARLDVSLLRGAIAQAHGFFDPAMCLQTLCYPSKVVGLEIGAGQLSQHRVD
jgi:hypothetical protein